MSRIKITARPYGGEKDYLPTEQQGLLCRIVNEQKQSSAESPLKVDIQITNSADMMWRGVIKAALKADIAVSGFFLPGFMYGINRGDAPLVVDSKCPRIREHGNFPASPWWMIRSDRLSHPCAFAYGDGRLIGFAASPYFIHKDGRQTPWKPGSEGEFSQYAGFGCSLNDKEVWYTLGYENAPWMFVDSHKYHAAETLDNNCFCIAPGETVSFSLYCFELQGSDKRILHDALKWVYSAFHESPRQACSVYQTVKDITQAIKHDAWLPEAHTYSGFVFDKGDHFEYNRLPSVSWTNGLAAAMPMLASSHRLKDEDMRLQALDCIEHIVENSMNYKSGLPYTIEQDGKWSNCGWWYDKQPTPGHASYLVGQCVYLILKAYDCEMRECGVKHENWLDFA